jgi:nucleoside-diphosphate-sugar epimerase
MSINQKDNFNIYNVSTGVKTYVWELIESISKAFGFNKKEYPIKFLKGTIKDQFGIYGNSSKLEKELKWKPKIDIEKGIHMMAEHAKKNKS